MNYSFECVSSNDMLFLKKIIEKNDFQSMVHLSRNVNINDEIIRMLLKTNNIDVLRALVCNFKSKKYLMELLNITKFDGTIIYFILINHNKINQKVYDSILNNLLLKFKNDISINLAILFRHHNFNKNHIKYIINDYFEILLKNESKTKLIRELISQTNDSDIINSLFPIIKEIVFDSKINQLTSQEIGHLLISHNDCPIHVLDFLITNNFYTEKLLIHQNLDAVLLLKIESKGFNVKSHKNYLTSAQLALSKIKK